MTVHHEGHGVTLHHGDCLDILGELPDASVDAVVTDPPYGLGFMGKAWDDLPPGVEWAAECLRVLKPGGHLLTFGGTRTWHRLACAIEDAGFEIRDSIAWMYGAGFPKAWNFSTQYKGEWCSCSGANALPYSHADNTDLPGVRDDVYAPTVTRSESGHGLLLAEVQRRGPGQGMGEARAQGSGGVVGGDDTGLLGANSGIGQPVMEGRVLHRAGQGVSDGTDAGPSQSQGKRLRGRAPAGDGVDDRASGDATRGGPPHQRRQDGQPPGEPSPVRGPHGALDDRALRDGPVCTRCGGLDSAFRGFSTALKPSFEPIVVARKPLGGTVAGNVLTHGTGALNIDGCRIGMSDADRATIESAKWVGRNLDRTAYGDYGTDGTDQTMRTNPAGRWPANVVLDEHAAAELDQQSGETSFNKAGNFGVQKEGAPDNTIYGKLTNPGAPIFGFGDTGGASRFMYTAKADAAERPRVNGTAHPTVKPLDLMRWLVRLVTPPGGVVLEPFAGSGTTVEAALLEGMRCVAIEREADYLPLILSRIHRQRDPVAYVRLATPDDLTLFGEDTPA